MADTIDPQDASLKQFVKETVAETLQEQRALFREVLADVLEDFALADAVREGLETRGEARDVLRGPNRILFLWECEAPSEHNHR